MKEEPMNNEYEWAERMQKVVKNNEELMEQIKSMGFKPMNETTAKKIRETGRIMQKIHEEGYDEHKGFVDEALEYFLLDVLTEADFERLKQSMGIK